MPNSIKTHEKNSIEIFKNKNHLNSNINKKSKIDIKIVQTF